MEQQTAPAENKKKLTLSGDERAIDVLEVLESTLSERETTQSIACLERLDELWSDAYDAAALDGATLPHARAIAAATKAMWLAGIGDLADKATKQQFGYGCMLFLTLIDTINDNLEEDHPGTAARALDAAESGLQGNAMAPNVTLASIFNTGLNGVMGADETGSVALVVLRALQSYVGCLVDDADDEPTTGDEHESPKEIAGLPAERVAPIFSSGVLYSLCRAALKYSSSADVHASVIAIVSTISGSRPDLCMLRDSLSVCDALIHCGTLQSMAHAIRTFAHERDLMLSTTALLSALTRGEAGRAAARACGMPAALEVLLREWPNDDELQREMSVLRAFIGSEDLQGILRELGVPDGALVLDDDPSKIAQAAGEMMMSEPEPAPAPAPPPAHRATCIAYGLGDDAGVATYYY